MLVVFEGIDGSGKTSTSKIVLKSLLRKGIDTAWFREPTDMKWGKKLRDVFESGKRLSAEEELDLMMKDRRDDVEKRIKPSLSEGKVVLLDRYYYSTAVYQGSLGLNWEKIVRDSEDFAALPDLVVFLSVSPEIALKRIEREGRKKTSPENLTTLTTLDEMYRTMFNAMRGEKEYEIITVDTDAKSLQEVGDIVLTLIKKRI